MSGPTAEDVRAAHRLIAPEIEDTPCLASHTLSEMLGCRLYLKCENLQFTGSFKERGALTRLSQLTAEEREAGVIAASAGNHAQGVAYHAQRMGIRAVMVMPETAPKVKIARVRSLGAEIVLHGTTFADATARAIELAAAEGMTRISAFDDAAIVAGQGTVALEMLARVPDLDTLVVPIGGGGLIAGMALAAKSVRPDIRMVGVRSELFAHGPPPMPAAGAPSWPSIADGIAVPGIGEIPGAIIAREVDRILSVSEADLEEAIVLLLEIEKTLSEGAGAAPLAAIKANPDLFAGRKVGMVLSGGNIDTSVLATVLQRVQLRRGLLFRMTATINDRPGELGRLAQVIAACGANIRDVRHDRVFSSGDARSARLIFEVECQTLAQRKAVLERLEPEVPLLTMEED